MESRSVLDIDAEDSTRPIVVLLGAGASKAACPRGDRHGRPLPVMNELIDVVGLRPLIQDVRIPLDSPNFEMIYGTLATEPANAALVETIERKVFKYFAALELPEQPTVYDHLLVSLRPKDCIITFNWDPLILQAIERTAARAGVPRVLALHGNVALGYCCHHAPMMMGYRGCPCRRCGDALGPERLLYPADKDYTSDPIKTLWETAQTGIREAMLFTVFGYSAPASDKAAKNLIQSAWDDAKSRTLADTEIIDLKAKDPDLCKQLEQQWRPFVHNQYAEFIPDYWTSRIARSPRRTAEMMIASQLDMEYIDDCTSPRDAGWDGFWQFYGPLIAQEKKT